MLVEFRLDRRWGKRRGAATAEMAAIMALFVVPFTLGIMEVSRMCMVSQMVTNAAREGCRVAVKNGNVSSDVTTRVYAVLSSSGIPSNLVTTALSPTTIESTHLGDAITLTVSVYFNRVSWMPYSYFFGSTRQVVGTATMSSERP